MAGLPGFTFNVARYLRRMEQYLMDLMLERERIGLLHDRIDSCLEDMIRNYALAGVDAVFFPEDGGTQQQMLIGPELWRQEFFPRTRRLCRLAHDLGIRVVMHSCGRIGAIVPGLMEAGVDELQFDQPELHGVDNLAAYGDKGRITFRCPVDIQRILPSGNEKLIRSKARELLDKIWRRHNGGFIAAWYSDEAAIGVDPVWQEWACDEFLRHGVLQRVAIRSPHM